MADSVISALPAVGALTAADLIPIVQAGVTSKATASQLASLANQLATTAATTSVATGTGDALLATFNPVVAALVNGAQYTIRAPGSNTVPIPTLQLGALAAKPLVKGSNVPLQVGDISGNRHWLEVVYDSALDKFVLGNPVYPAVAAGDFAMNSLTVPAISGLTSLNGGPLSGLRNRLINGDMRIDQRNAGAAILNSRNYIVDRWADFSAGPGVYTAQQVLDGPIPFTHSLKHTVTTAVAVVGAAETYQLFQGIEGYNAADLAYGTPQAKSATLGFWVKSSRTGKFSCFLYSTVTTTFRGVVQNYTINAANTWEYKTVTFPGDTVLYSDRTNGQGLAVGFDLGSGSNVRTAPANVGVWQPQAVRATTDSINFMDTVASTIQFTGIQFEVGTVATPFEFRPYSFELSLCQRYFQWLPPCSGRWQGVSTSLNVAVTFPVPMRVSPTATFFGTLSAEEYGVAFRAISGVAAGSASTAGYYGSITTAAATNPNSGGVTASGPTGGIALSSEL